LRIDGSWTRESRRRSPGCAVQARRLGARWCMWQGLDPSSCVSARDRTPNRGGESSGGTEPQESTDGRFQAGQPYGIVAERTPGGSKASKRACRPFTGEPNASGKWTVRAVHLRVCRGDRTNDRRERQSWLMRPGSAFGWARAAKSWRETGKRSRRSRGRCAGDGRRANPQGSRWPARAGTAPREGKALEGRSRDASGMKEGREASGATANGGVQKTLREPRAS